MFYKSKVLVFETKINFGYMIFIFVKTSVTIERNNLEAGDHISTLGVVGYFYHHGIYVGEGRVIHLTKLNGWHGAVYSTLDSFLNGCPELRRTEYTTDDAASDNAEVVRRAYSAVQFGFGDNMLDCYDSKTFAMYCKTGKYISRSNYRHGVPHMRNHRSSSTIHEFRRPHHIDNPFPSASHRHDIDRIHAFNRDSRRRMEHESLRPNSRRP
ncbi:hypothetical protein ABFX02_10G064000 [Erythranthe guttata]